VLAACVIFAGVSAHADDFERIETEEEFFEKIVAKRLEYQSGAIVVFTPEGTFDGGFSGSPVWGEWVWRDDTICHQINIGEKRYKVTCKTPQILGKKVRFLREDGSSYGEARIR
jgi:hypothetical protein